MAAVLMQQPNIPKNDDVANEGQVLEEDGESTEGNEATSPPDGNDKEEASQGDTDPTDSTTPVLTSNQDTQKENASTTEGASDGDDAKSATDNPDEKQPEEKQTEDKQPEENGQQEKDELKLPQKFYTLGSLAPGDNKRFLVTLNSKGATVRRVESATLKKNGRLAYRDLEYEGGYLGELECTPDGGCRVRAVGQGTPAQVAGMQVGDLIVQLDGEPVVSHSDLIDSLAEKKSGDSVDLKVTRTSDDGESSHQFSIELTDKPLEFIAPSYSVTTGEALPESFLLTLHQCNEVEPYKWIVIDKALKTANWEGTYIQGDDGSESVEFQYTIPKSVLKRDAVGLDGPLKVVKTYSIQPIEGEGEFGRSWHFSLNLRFEYYSAEPIEFAYELGGPTGLTTEGYWYQIKINGSGSFFGMAGARDVTAETVDGRFVFLDNPDLVKNQRKDPARQKDKYLFDPYESKDVRAMKYFGVDTQYFNVSVMPVVDEESSFVTDGGFAWPMDSVLPENTRDDKRVDCSGVILKKVKFPKGNQGNAGRGIQQKFDIFAGPKEPELLSSYGLDNNMAFGWFSMFSKPLLWLLHVLYMLTFKITYAIPVILLTVMVRCIMIPISRKAALNAQMMQYLSPQLKEIKEKYPDDMQQQMQAQQALFRKHKYNPFSGCLMGFIQLPIFLGLYRGLSADIALRDQPLIPGMSWCSNLAAPDQFLRWDSWMPAFLASETGWLGPYLNVLPLLTIALFVINAKMFTPPPTDEQQAMMQKMMTYMMFFMGFLFFKVPSGLCLYFITSSIWGIAERQLLPKPKLDTDKLAAMDATGDNVVEAESFTNKTAIEDRKRRDKERKRRLKERDRDA